MLQNDLDGSREELRAIRDRNELQESSRFQLEITLRDQESELRELRSQFNTSQINNQAILCEKKIL